MIIKIPKLSFCLFITFSFLVTFGITQENKPVTNDVLLNGDFEQELNIGWQTSSNDYTGSSEITRNQVEKNHYAHLIKDLCGYAELSQIINLDNLNQDLSARLNLNATSNRAGYNATAAFILSFLDKENKVLAETQIAYSTDQLTNTPVPYSYPAKPAEWKTYTLNLKDELDKHFSKVDVSKIKKLKITLSAYNDQTNGC
jgi:hypothetical protein